MAGPITTRDAQGLGGEPAAADTFAPRTFIAEQSAGSLLRNTVAVYRANFRPLFLAYILPTFPFLFLQQVAEATKNTAMFLTTAVIGWIVSFVALGALTVIISDICLGNVPLVQRAYGRILKDGIWLRLLVTGILQMLLWTVGLLLLLIPGIVLMIRMIVCSTVVVVEGDWGWKGIKRSMALSKGHFWRLFAVLALLSLILLALSVLAMIVIGIGVAVLGETYLELAIGVLFGALMQGVLYPMLFIAIVLLYYDLRARKEAYDVEALAEDMMR
jgi:hypothetical protein